MLAQTGTSSCSNMVCTRKGTTILAMPVARKMMATETAATWPTMFFHAGSSKLRSPKLAVVVALIPAILAGLGPLPEYVSE